MQPIIDFIVTTVGSLGYTGIFVMMFLESSFFPFPSEVVMIPAGYLAWRGEMSVVAAVAAGTAGSLAGALFNYWLACWVGRALLLRYGRWVLVRPETLDRMERFFRDHGEISTFNGRLLPGIRQYISLPAGLARMPLARFSLYTSLGAGIWVLVLALLGYFLGANQALLHRYLREITIAAIAFVVVSSALYLWLRRRRSPADPG